MTRLEDIAESIVKGLVSAWNAGDGPSYATFFTDDADVINIFGMAFHGREAITALMVRILGTIFKGSFTHHEIVSAVALGQDVILVQLAGGLTIRGPQPRQTQNRQTLVLTQEQGVWRIRSFQNTGVNESAPAVACP